MPTISLPDDPTVGHLRRLARRLQRAVRAGDPEAAALTARYDFPAGPDFPLSAAQLVVARECGFNSWPALRRQLELLAGFRRDPDAVPAGTDPADDFCRLACLVYSAEDGPDRWAAAAALLAAQPELPARSVAAAATAGDPTALAAHLADPAAASARTGPYGWEPLLYLTYSRVPQVDPVRAATLLLDAGADPDADPDTSSPEGRALPLAAAAGHREIVELLLAAGAEPVELSPVDGLVAAVLAGDEAGVDRAVLPAALADRPGLVAEAVEAGADPELAVRLGFDVSARHAEQTALHTAAWNGDLDLVRRLVALGADLDARGGRFDGRPVDWAGHAGHPDVVSFLADAERARGGPAPWSRPAGTGP